MIRLGKKHQPYLIGETAFHHEGDLAFLKELALEIASQGADAIKFHLLLDLPDYMVPHHDAYPILEKWALGEEDWKEVLAAVRPTGVEIILLCNDVRSVEFACAQADSVRAIELHATGINDIFLLEAASAFPGMVILGSGGSTLEEVQFAVDFLRGKGKEAIFLMHGFQNYPTRFEDIDLGRMLQLRDFFGVQVGYADHTDPRLPDNAWISALGAAMGFEVLEKHFTNVPGQKRTDSQAAVPVDQIPLLKEKMKMALAAHGEGNYKMSPGELQYGNTGPMKKALVASRKIQKGEKLSPDNIAFKRTMQSSYMAQRDFARIVGMEASQDIEANELLDFGKIKFTFQAPDLSAFTLSKEAKQ